MIISEVLTEKSSANGLQCSAKKVPWVVVPSFGHEIAADEHTCGEEQNKWQDVD